MHYQYCGWTWPFSKIFQQKTFKEEEDCDTNINILNQPSEFLYTDPATSIK